MIEHGLGRAFSAQFAAAGWLRAAAFASNPACARRFRPPMMIYLLMAIVLVVRAGGLFSGPTSMEKAFNCEQGPVKALDAGGLSCCCRSIRSSRQHLHFPDAVHQLVVILRSPCGSLNLMMGLWRH